MKSVQQRNSLVTLNALSHLAFYMLLDVFTLSTVDHFLCLVIALATFLKLTPPPVSFCHIVGAVFVTSLTLGAADSVFGSKFSSSNSGKRKGLMALLGLRPLGRSSVVDGLFLDDVAVLSFITAHKFSPVQERGLKSF